MNFQKLQNAKEINDYLFAPLKKISRQLSKLDTNSTNGVIDDDKYNKREATLIKRAENLLAEFNAVDLKIYHQGDPRGCALYIIDATMDNTNYTNGIAIF